MVKTLTHKNLLSKNNILFVIFCLLLVFGMYFKLAIEHNLIPGFRNFDNFILLILVLYYFTQKKIRFSKLFLSIILVMIFYLFYSLKIKTTIPQAILFDFFQQLRAFFAFCIFFSLKPNFSKNQLKFIRITCIALSTFSMYIIFFGNIGTFFSHVTFFAANTLVLSYVYYFSSSKSKLNIVITILLLALGLFSTRSKFYGEFILTVFILFFIRKEIKLSIKTLIVSLILCGTIIFFAWNKISFYFITGAENGFARAVFYKNSLEILSDYFPLGSGFGTYGTPASSRFYSPLYYKYNMDKIQGVSEADRSFITDTYYPTLAQFGYIGICLFILFWKCIYNIIQRKFQITGNIKMYQISLLLTGVILIDSVADITLLSYRGTTIMAFLGIVLTNVYKKNKPEVLYASNSY